MRFPTLDELKEKGIARDYIDNTILSNNTNLSMYCSFYYNEMRLSVVQRYLATGEIYNEIPIFKVKITSDMTEEEYFSAQGIFLEKFRMYIASLQTTFESLREIRGANYQLYLYDKYKEKENN